MKELDTLREQIDRVDEQILKLLNRRARVVQKIARLKSDRQTSTLIPRREFQIVRRLCKNNPGPFPNHGIESAFREILSACRSLQKPVDVYYLGPQATYTHAAAVARFGRGAHHIPVANIVQVFREVEKHPYAFGIVPIENSSEGVVGLTMDLLLESPLSICWEVYLPIRHHLLSNVAKKKIQRLYSKDQAIAQCRGWLAKNLPDVEIHETASTARGVELAIKDKAGAAIAGKLAGQIYPIKIQNRDIHDRAGNTTRFIVIGHLLNEPSGKDKTSIIFLVKNRVGALYDALVPFRENSINLTKIESRPTKREAWEYAFYVDLEGHREDKKVIGALKALEDHIEYVKVLGSYPDETRWSLA